jgi:multidrug resistance efflux pump
LVQAQSNVAYTEADYTRGQALVRDKTITDQTFEQRAQAFRNAKASVTANEAAVRQAELDLEFTELRAPVDGRIGDRRVSPGNLVTGGTSGNTTLLATSCRPIRSISNSPSTRPRICVTSGCRRRGRTLRAATRA